MTVDRENPIEDRGDRRARFHPVFMICGSIHRDDPADGSNIRLQIERCRTDLHPIAQGMGRPPESIDVPLNALYNLHNKEAV